MRSPPPYSHLSAEKGRETGTGVWYSKYNRWAAYAKNVLFPSIHQGIAQVRINQDVPGLGCRCRATGVLLCLVSFYRR